MIEQSTWKLINTFIKETIDSRMICMLYDPTTEQVVDVLTNRASQVQFDYLINKLAMEDVLKSA
jgi:hypothetical protein